MKIIVASKNRTKIAAVQTVFPEATVIGQDFPSDVSSQPFGDEETLQGAINRAKHAMSLSADGFGIGLEGGVFVLSDELYLCNWGALMTAEGKLYKASGARIPLPQCFLRDLQAGTELSELMNAYTKRHDIGHHEGAIGIFTNKLLLRDEMFSQVVQLLKGQWQYWEGQD